MSKSQIPAWPELVEGLPFPFNATMSFWAYMLHCNGGSFYVGHTDDLERRIAEHEGGHLPGYSRDHLPVVLVRSNSFPTREEAKAAKLCIKGWSRAKKLALIRGDWDEIQRLARNKGRPSTGSGRTGDEEGLNSRG